MKDTDYKKWADAYFIKPSATATAAQERAFNALLAYELNCCRHEARYLDPRMAKIPKGERMDDFAMRYGTTVWEMKKEWRHVEEELGN